MDAADRKALLRWYRRVRRDLPWRRSRDPYAIWVSEVMLQQTRVAAAIPHYERWMSRFPTVAALASATEEEVLQAWSGLGYYSRARNLHAAARAVVEVHGGQVPRTAAVLRGLSGVGPYTAGAIASIAYGEPVPAVDGNVVRVACRVAGILDDPASPAVGRRIEALAAAWVPAQGAGDWNQAVMELGATVCTPKSPGCNGCPVARSCKAKAKRDTSMPRPRRRTAHPQDGMHFAVVVQDGRVLLVRNPPGLLGGLWSLPGGPESIPLAALVHKQTGIPVRVGRKEVRLQHMFTHRTWQMRIRMANRAHPSNQVAHPSNKLEGARGPASPHGRPASPTPGRGALANRTRQTHAVIQGRGTQETKWLPLDEVGTAALSSAMRSALRSVGVE